MPSPAGRDSAAGGQTGQQSPAQQSAGEMQGTGTAMPAVAGTPGTSGATTAGGTAQTPAGGQRDASGVQSGATGANYSLDSLPGGLGDPASGPMTAEERAAVFTGALNRGYEEFDGVILAERARAQAEANAARNTEIPGDSGGAAAGAGQGAQAVIVDSRPGEVDAGPQGSRGAGGGAAPQQQQETFPPPEDIPSGRDDDIVARQLREAAMREADPELREALWDEYRRYTGIGG